MKREHFDYLMSTAEYSHGQYESLPPRPYVIGSLETFNGEMLYAQANTEDVAREKLKERLREWIRELQ